MPGFIDEGPETGRRDFNWEAQGGGLTVELRSLTVGTGFTRLELRVDGVRRGRAVSALQRLRIRDADGGDLLAGGEIARIDTAGSRPAPGGGIDTEVVLDRPIDLQAVATVELGGLTVGRNVRERVGGTLVDRELRRRSTGTLDDMRWLASRRDCPGCQLRVTCVDCTTMRIVGSAYRRSRVLIAIEALDRVELTALNPSRRRVLVTDENGFTELPAWIDGSGGAAVISIAGEHAGRRLARQRPRRRPDGLQRPDRGPDRAARPRQLDHPPGGWLMRAWCPRCDAVRPGATACPVCGTTLATLDDPGPADHPPDLPPPEAAAGPPPRSRLRIALAAATLVVAGLAFVAGRSIARPGAPAATATPATTITAPDPGADRRELGWTASAGGVTITALEARRLATERRETIAAITFRIQGVPGDQRVLALRGLRLLDSGGGVFATVDQRQFSTEGGAPVEAVDTDAGTYQVLTGPAPSPVVAGQDRADLRGGRPAPRPDHHHRHLGPLAGGTGGCGPSRPAGGTPSGTTSAPRGSSSWSSSSG